MKNIRVTKVTDIHKYQDFINSFAGDGEYGYPYMADEAETGKMVRGMLSRKDRFCVVTEDDQGVNGLYIFMIIPEEKYLEMLMEITREESSVDGLLSFLEKNYPGYEVYFVFNPLNHLIRAGLEKRGAEFWAEQSEMVYTHNMPECETASVEALSADYIDQYLKMHSTDFYWTGEKIINAPDRFKTFIAVEDGIVTGYIDVSYGDSENEPYDILVKEEYRQKGYGKQLLAKALKENEPAGMILMVDIDNVPALNLYKSLGFVKKEHRDNLTAFRKMPEIPE